MMKRSRPALRPTAKTTLTAASARDHRSASPPALDETALASVRGGCNPNVDMHITAEDDWESPPV